MKLIALITVVLLAGCAGHNKLAAEYEKNLLASDAEKARLKERAARCLPHTGCASRDETPEQFEQRKILEEATAIDEQAKSALREKDMAVCRYEAAKATGSSQRGYTVYSTIFNDVGDTFRQAEIIGLCMKSKGYAK